MFSVHSTYATQMFDFNIEIFDLCNFRKENSICEIFGKVYRASQEPHKIEFSQHFRKIHKKIALIFQPNIFQIDNDIKKKRTIISTDRAG